MIMPELTEEEYQTLEELRTTYVENEHVVIHEYIDGNGTTHEFKVFSTEIGIKWIMNNGDEDRKQTKVIYAPTMIYGEPETEDFLYFVRDTVPFITRHSYIFHIAENIIGYTYCWIDTWSMYYSLTWHEVEASNRNLINFKLKGIPLISNKKLTEQEKIMATCQTFARSVLIYTTDTAHPRHAAWVSLATRFAAAGREIPKNSTEINIAWFNALRDGFAEEINNLLLPGETF